MTTEGRYSAGRHWQRWATYDDGQTPALAQQHALYETKEGTAR